MAQEKYQGLNSNEAQLKLQKYGFNEFPKDKPLNPLLIFLRQFKNPLVYILILAALIALVLNHLNDTVIISFTVFVNSLIGFLQEYKAQKELFALRNLFSSKAIVWRDRKKQEIESRYLVPGDLIVVRAGEKVPADAVVVQENDLLVNEAVLTGESKEVGKKEVGNGKWGVGDGKWEQASVTNSHISHLTSHISSPTSIFMGTEVLQGWVKAIVINTGLQTEMGKIALMLKHTEDEETPLQGKIKNLSKKLALIFLVVSFLVFVLGLVTKKPAWELLTTSVALGVSAVPEGLAVSLTVILALGMQKIFKRQALVRRLVSAETLGSVTTICTDKTGTLTEGKMKVVYWQVKNEEEAVKVISLCNNRVGPVDLALWEFAHEKSKIGPQQLTVDYQRKDEIPFSSMRKYMAVFVVNKDKADILVKGAPELILSWCKIGINEKEEWANLANEWGKKGVRVIALAEKSCKRSQADGWKAHLEFGFNFLGLIGFSDPIRSEAKESLLACQQAGIKVMMITGDFRATAENVSQQLNLLTKSEEILEGAELEKLSDEEFLEKVKQIKLFARTTPAQKLKIVEALKKSGEIVAMTGDGVNDAPALKRADIGIVVENATEVARETADLVLLDSSFKTIVAAIEEGRAIFDNVRKIILYLLSDAFSEIILLFLSFMFGFPLPLLASQILWINFIDDGPTSLALTVDPKEKGLMKRLPRNPKVSLIDKEMRFLIILISGFTGIASFLIFMFVYKMFGDLNLARATVFTFLSLDSVLYVYSCKTLQGSVFADKAFNNKWLNIAVISGIILTTLPLYVPVLRSLLQLSPLQLEEWGMVVAASVMLILFIEVVKHLFNKSEK